MKTKLFLCLLSLTGSFLQAFASLSEKDLHAPSSFSLRKKRVIDETHDRDEKFLHQEVRYAVILISENIHCTGIILAPHVILTAAHCMDKHNIVVVSGIPHTPMQRFHNIVNVIVHEGYKRGVLIVNDLALIVIREPIDIRVPHAFNRAISIYDGTLPPNSEGLVSGWGCCSKDRIEHPKNVRSILVPILNQHVCREFISSKLDLTEKHICTLYPNREKCCGHGDSGAPLVYDGKLIGVFSALHDHPHMADIFMNLLDPEYKLWVESWVTHINNSSMYLH